MHQKVKNPDKLYTLKDLFILLLRRNKKTTKIFMYYFPILPVIRTITEPGHLDIYLYKRSVNGGDKLLTNVTFTEDKYPDLIEEALSVFGKGGKAYIETRIGLKKLMKKIDISENELSGNYKDFIKQLKRKEDK